MQRTCSNVIYFVFHIVLYFAIKNGVKHHLPCQLKHHVSSVVENLILVPCKVLIYIASCFHHLLKRFISQLPSGKGILALSIKY